MFGLKSARARAVTPPQAPEPAGPHVDLFYWRPAGGGQNFGDHLSSVIATKVAADAGYFFDEIVAPPRRLLAIGSILHFARDGDTVWGSGVNGKMPVERHRFERLDVRAVRGPLTRDFLIARGIDVPAVYGDPALLIARLLGARFARPAQTVPVAFVPNLHDLPQMDGWENVVSPLWPWAAVVRGIVAAEHVVSSSLHGLVIADAFDIPCTYLRLSETENLFKFEDYAFGAGRGTLAVATSREEAIRSTPLDPIRPDLDALIAAFPLDLWRAG